MLYNLIGQIICSNFSRRYEKLWTLVATSVISELGETVETYGISCGETTIGDISLCKQEISEFVDLLNRLDASEIHAYELVENFLGRY